MAIRADDGELIQDMGGFATGHGYCGGMRHEEAKVQIFIRAQHRDLDEQELAQD